MTIAIEIPETLSEQFRVRQIPEKEIEAVAIAALEIWLAQRPPTQAETAGRFSESALPFVRQLVAQNRELFEALAQR
jgi:hypothetical protein